MAKFMNVVRYVVKADCHDEFIELHSSSVKKGDGLYGRLDGMLSQFLIKTGEYSYCFVAIWESESALAEARPFDDREPELNASCAGGDHIGVGCY